MQKLYYTTESYYENNDILRCGRELKSSSSDDNTIIYKCNKLLEKIPQPGSYTYYKVSKNNIINMLLNAVGNRADKVEEISVISINNLDLEKKHLVESVESKDYKDTLVDSNLFQGTKVSNIIDYKTTNLIYDEYTINTKITKDFSKQHPKKDRNHHYIWYVFPQLDCINYFIPSPTTPKLNTYKYGLDSIYTAFYYLCRYYRIFKKNFEIIKKNPDFFTSMDDILKFDNSIKLFILVAKMIQNDTILQYLQNILNIFYSIESNKKYLTVESQKIYSKKSNITQQVIDKQYLLIDNDKKTGDEKLSFDPHIMNMKFVENRKHTSRDASKLKTNYYHPVNILFQENFKIVKAGILDELDEIDGTKSSPFNDVIVDPANNGSLTSKLGGGEASGAIYKMYEIYNAELNTDINNILKANNNFESDNFLFIEKSQTFKNGGLIRTAQYKNNVDKQPIVNINKFENESKNIIIHVVGPRNGDEKRFLDILIYCYEQVFLQFINIIKITKRPLTLRLLPISGGVFSITTDRASKASIALFCIARAYDNLSLDDKFELDKSTIKLCIFVESEQTLFTKLHKDIKLSTEHLYTFFKNNTFLNKFLTPPEILQKLINPELST